MRHILVDHARRYETRIPIGARVVEARGKRYCRQWMNAGDA